MEAWHTGDWEYKQNKLKCDGKCPHAEKTKKRAIITKQAERKIRTLINKIPELEWMAILQGTIENNTITIQDLFIPEQIVTKGHVETTTAGSIQAQEVQNKIGWIHSHNQMAAFMSTNDEETASQHLLSIVINNRLEHKALIKEKLPCGTEVLKPIETTFETMQTCKETTKQIEEKIFEKIETIENDTNLEQWNREDTNKEITGGVYVYDQSQNKWVLEDKLKQREQQIPKGISKKQWKKAKGRGMTPEEGKIGKGWQGTCEHCNEEVKKQQKSVIIKGELYHKECAEKKIITEEYTKEEQYRIYN